MSKNLLNKYVWLVETIYNAKYISFDEINRRWLDNDISEGLEIPKRTFHTWINEAEELFGLSILCEHFGDFRYYIEFPEDIKKGGLRNWLLNTISTSNLLMENKQLKERILLEEVPSVKDHLSPILAAMRTDTSLLVTYQSFWRDESNTFEVEPYCVKLFKQRWYLLGRSPEYKQVRIYALDRILNVEALKKKFKMPKKFEPAAFFDSFYGIIAHEHPDIETVRLKVSAGQSNYLRSLPLHASQKELVRTGEYSIFSVEVRPTFDFQQELLWNGDAIEVLEPLWLRDDMAEIVKRMWNNYNKK